MKKSDLKFIPKFYDKYINCVPDEMQLITGLRSTKNYFYTQKDHFITHQNTCLSKNNWTPKDILQHIIDNERIQSYRALAFSRNDVNHLSGFNQELYAKFAKANHRNIQDLLKEFIAQRNSTINLFKSFTNNMLNKEGLCSGIKVNVAALGFLIIGHTLRYSNILNELYFNAQSKSSS
ncbi:hypothetical protein MHTCC0001_29630 [Flavobacteriaceae bacterium MHTCC 0001]